MAETTHEIHISFELFRAIGELYKKSEQLLSEELTELTFEVKYDARPVAVNVRRGGRDDILTASPQMQAKYPLLVPDETGRKRFTKDILQTFTRQWGEEKTMELLGIRTHEFRYYLEGVRTPRISTLSLWKLQLEELPPNLKEDEKSRFSQLYPGIWKQISV